MKEELAAVKRAWLIFLFMVVATIATLIGQYLPFKKGSGFWVETTVWGAIAFIIAIVISFHYLGRKKGRSE